MNLHELQHVTSKNQYLKQSQSFGKHGPIALLFTLLLTSKERGMGRGRVCVDNLNTNPVNDDS